MTAGSTPAAFTLHGSALSWLDLMLSGAVTARYQLPPAARLEPSRPSLAIPTEQVREALDSGTVNLLDPEGVTLAQLAVEQHHPFESATWLAGPVTAVTGFQHVDHADLRQSPSAVSSSWPAGPVVALWDSPPTAWSLREAARNLARTESGALLEVIPVPSGQETSREAQIGPRLARLATTRDAADRSVVIPEPDLGWSAEDVLARAEISRSYGATVLALSPLVAAELGTAKSEVEAAAAALGVDLRVLDVPTTEAGLSQQQLDELLETNADIPAWFAEPAVADEIRQLVRPPSRAGFTVLLSGLSGSGKSTVARALAIRLLEREVRSVSLLDGDVVRHHLSKGLGFAKADRDTNVRRIGFVASEITKAGGIAICCPIAPYAATRQDVREMVETNGGYVLVHVSTPLEECERRDRKGLYAKARRGEIPEFTGISDPYEAPTDADVVVDTTGRTIESCVDDVMAGLVAGGYVSP